MTLTPEEKAEKERQRMHEYYLRVTKKKREQARQNKKPKEAVTQTVTHECPVCGKIWKEKVTQRYPKYVKSCPACVKLKRNEYGKTDERREKRRIRARERYHNSEDFRAKVLKKQKKYEAREDVKERKREYYLNNKPNEYLLLNLKTMQGMVGFHTMQEVHDYLNKLHTCYEHVIVPCKVMLDKNAKIKLHKKLASRNGYRYEVKLNKATIEDCRKATTRQPMGYVII